MNRPVSSWGLRVSRPTLAWLAIAASLPLLVLCASRLSSGFDYWPAVAIERHVPYGTSFIFAYPLPIYLPFAPLGLLPGSLPQLVAPIVCFAFLASGLWLWGARRGWVIGAALLSPVGVGVLVNSNFNSAVSLFGLGLAIRAKRAGHHPLVGLGVALSLWRPTNCLPALVVLLLSGWRWRDLVHVVVAAALFIVPLTALAFVVQPDWLNVYLQILPVYRGWAGLGPHLLNSGGPIAYAAAQLAVAGAGVWVLRRRPVEDAAALSLALSVLLATTAGAYSGALALPALVRAASDERYTALPALASLVGWGQVAVLLAIGFPVGVVSYWFVVQAYPLLGKAPPELESRHVQPSGEWARNVVVPSRR